jgi:hypothetical protein
VDGVQGVVKREQSDGDEWPRMHEGKDSAGASGAVNGMYTATQGVDPRSPREVAFYDDSVS